jgi:uncharacterized damage-inducible protein DinB
MTEDLAELFARKSCDLLTSDYLPKIERCVERLNEDLVWRRPNDASNSIGNLILHLSGNVTEWIIGGVGQQPYERNRPQEFAAVGPVPATELVRALGSIVTRAADIIGGLDDAALVGRRRIQGYDVTVLDAVYHVVEHFGMHTGQIIMVTKMYTGKDLKLWQPPVGRT